MDYGPMIEAHTEKNADITVGTIQVPLHEATGFGVMSIDEENRIKKFSEKPVNPEPVPGNPDAAMASMGIYVFNRDFLLETLQKDAEDPDSSHDFGNDVIPKHIDSHRVFAYPFHDVKTRAQSYWRDVGTVDAYFRANLELVYVHPELNLYDADEMHPSYLGSYLGAAVYFATIFRESPAGNLFSGAATEVTATYLQNVASEVVLDSLSLWRLDTTDGKYLQPSIDSLMERK